MSESFFSGTVVAVSKDQVRVSRAEETRTFRITPATKIEGRLVSKARVTVGYATTDQGDVATRIIVRSSRDPQP